MISVIVPVHDEERSVALLHDELASALGQLDESWEVVFVDDGSTDGTFAALTRLHAAHENVRVVRLRRNFGKAAALQCGFEEAQGDIVVTIDGDLQDDPAEIPRLLAKLEEGFDLVSGWKTKRRDPLTRRIPSRIFNTVTGRLSGLRLHDMNCGLKAYRAEVVQGLPLYGELHRFIPVLAHYRGFRVAELPVNHRPREHGRSRYGLERYVRGFLDLLTVTFMGRYRHRPLHLFGGLGLLLGAVGTLVLIYLTVLKLTGEAIGQRPLLTLGVLLVVVGVQLVSLGLVSELIAEPPRGAHRRRPDGRAARGRDPALSLTVLYFGTYERDYPRNAQVISCLRGAGVEVVERHVSVWERQRHKWSLGIGVAARIGLAEARLLLGSRRERFDAVIVGYPGHFDLPAAKRLARGRPVIFNPLVSLHETLVEDRGRFAAGSAAARVLRRVDRVALRRADLVVADTEQNARHLAELAELPAERLAVCFVGAEERLFRPGRQPPGTFRALFVGKLIPLHGLETILAAARLAPEIPFRVVGSGQLDALLLERPSNVEWVEWVDYERLPEEIQRAGCALGVFGTSAKAGRVIPNKAFQALACGTPLVTADTPAARELLRDGESALLVPPGDPEALAAAVRRLAGEPELALSIGAGGLATYRAQASERVLGERWRGLVEQLVGS